MALYKGKYRVETARLRGWDYSAGGAYFVTLCTQDRAMTLGEVIAGEVHLSEAGEIVADEWQKTERIRPYVTLDQWVIMPNHLHGIIIITDAVVETPRRGVSTRGVSTRGVSTVRDVSPRGIPTRGVSTTTVSRLKPRSLGAIIGQVKSICTKRIRASGFPDFGWQPRFYDHIIRSEESLQAIRQYIRENPAKWGTDRDNRAHLTM